MDPRLERLWRQRHKQVERVKRLKLPRRPGLREALPDPSQGQAPRREVGQRRLAVILVSLLALIASVGAAFWSTRPQTLTLAAPRGEPEMVAFAERLRNVVNEAEGGELRLAVTAVDTIEEARDLLQRGAVQLAIVRSDVEPPPRARSVAYLREDVVLFLALREPPAAVLPKSESEAALPTRAVRVVGSGGDVEGKAVQGAAGEEQAEETSGQVDGEEPAAIKAESLANALRGKAVGLLAGSPSEGLLRLILAKHGLGEGAVTIVSDSWEALVEKLRRRELAALFTVEAPLGSGFVQRLAAATADPAGPRLRALDLPHAQALARRTQGVVSYDLAPGELLDRPALPEEEVGTMSVSWRLVTRSDASPQLIEALSRSIFDRRSAFADTGSMARTLKAPPYEKDAFIPIHLGTLVYINAEPKGLMELYGDYVYIGVSLVGLIASSAGYVVARVRAYAGW